MAVYAAVILIFSVVPVEPGLSVDHLDQLAHLCEYLAFAWLLVQAVCITRLRAAEYLWLAWIYATSYGLFIELIQGMIPWRSADLADALMNALGAGIGVWLGQRVPHRSSSVRSP